MKVQLPKIPAGLRETTDDVRILKPKADCERIILRGIEALGVVAPKMTFDESALDRVIAVNAAFDGISMMDTEVRGCDLSAAAFVGGSFRRVRFSNCRMAGIDLSRSTLTHITFSGCKLDMANFRFAKLSQVRFEDCTFVETDFQVGELSDVEFNDCTLEKVIFDQCKLRQVDARGSQLSQIHGWNHLRGLTIDHTQLMGIAHELASELGVKVE